MSESEVIFRYENIASVFILTFWNARILFITSLSENSQICHETIKFWAAKDTEIIKILLFFQKC